MTTFSYFKLYIHVNRAIKSTQLTKIVNLRLSIDLNEGKEQQMRCFSKANQREKQKLKSHFIRQQKDGWMFFPSVCMKKDNKSATEMSPKNH